MTAPAVRPLMDAFEDPDPVAWLDWISSPRLPDSTGMLWEPGDRLDDVGGHVWRDTRGPYSLCHRPGCRLAYSRWDGDDCTAAGWWRREDRVGVVRVKVAAAARRVRLLVKLVGQVRVGLRLATRAGVRSLAYRRHRSLVEALHRDLGHSYDPHVILRDHEGPL